MRQPGLCEGLVAVQGFTFDTAEWCKGLLEPDILRLVSLLNGKVAQEKGLVHGRRFTVPGAGWHREAF